MYRWSSNTRTILKSSIRISDDLRSAILLGKDGPFHCTPDSHSPICFLNRNNHAEISFRSRPYLLGTDIKGFLSVRQM